MGTKCEKCGSERITLVTKYSPVKISDDGTAQFTQIGKAQDKYICNDCNYLGYVRT